MAGETGTSGAAGGEFPVFKSSEGAFDRAKYEEQDKARIVSDGITARSTGKEIDEDLVKKKKSADQVIKEANKFYDDSFEKNVKGLDPAYDPSLIYYSEAYSDGGSNKNKIKRKLEKGETIDGKEIFEMSKEAAKNKIGNALVLKDGKVTDILNNLGISDVKNFDLYEDVKSDFNDKIKDEKIKFEPLLDNFSKLLQYFTVKESSLASQYAPILHTPENMAIISALAKVLEAEGFTNESVTNMSKKYDENIKKLIEKKEGKKAEDVIKEAAQEAKKEEAKKSTEESKIEEKKTESPTGPTGSTGTAIEGTNTVASATTGSTGPTTTTTTETITTVTTSTTGPTGSSTPGKVEGAKTSTTGGTGATGVTAADVKKRQEDLLSSILGIKFEAATGGTGTTGGNDKKNKEPEKKKEETKLEKPEEKKTEENKTSAQTPTTENKETKLEEKISPTTPAKTETSSTNTPIKETEQQNLSSVIIPESGSTGDNQNKQTEGTNQNTTTSTETKTTETKTEGGGTTNTQSETIKTEDKTAAEDKQKMDNEMAENMKAMVGLLTRLNNTLQNPLVVIPNNKKFG